MIQHRTLALAACTSLLLALGACGGGDDPGGESQDVTGINGVPRVATLRGYVYVDEDAGEETIKTVVQQQVKSFFGPLLRLKIGLDDRDMNNVDSRTFTQTKVTIIDPAKPTNTSVTKLRVAYTYESNAVVDKTIADKTSLPTVGLVGDYFGHGMDLIAQCTSDPEARDFGPDYIWYMFDPAVGKCQTRIIQEGTAIQQAAKALTDPKTQTTTVEVARWFLPSAVELRTTHAPARLVYPEYDRLYGVDPSLGGRKSELNIYGYFGVLGERRDNPLDEAYIEMFGVMQRLFQAELGVKVVGASPPVDLLDLQVNGEKVEDATYENVVDWALGQNLPPGVDSSALQFAILQRWAGRMIALSAPFTVTAGGNSRSFRANLRFYYGTASAPFYKEGFKNADVFIYSGHSNIGFGPLDPSNFTAADFPNRYQIMMFNSCVSYNYYNRDYYSLHAGGSKQLDIIANAMESESDDGQAVGALIRSLLSGKLESYQAILANMLNRGPWGARDPLRVVDGELDNVYNPARLPIRLAPAAQ